MTFMLSLLTFCCLLMCISSIIYKETLFLVPKQNQTRIKSFAFYALLGLSSMLTWDISNNSMQGKASPEAQPFLAGFFFILACLLLYNARKIKHVNQTHVNDTQSSLQSGRESKQSDFSIRVRSRSNPNQFYDLNLDELTCTCQDWQEKRTTQPKTMPGRLCKHLLSAVLDKPDILPPHLAQFYTLFEPVAREGRGMPVPSPRLSVCYGVRDNGTPFVLTHEPGSPWANVIVQGQRYGYNAEEDRWSYQRVPEDAAFWKKKLAELG